jgi:hypothetical protein
LKYPLAHLVAREKLAHLVVLPPCANDCAERRRQNSGASSQNTDDKRPQTQDHRVFATNAQAKNRSQETEYRSQNNLKVKIENPKPKLKS